MHHLYRTVLFLTCFGAFGALAQAPVTPITRAATNSDPLTVTNTVDLRPELEQFGLKPRLQGGRPTCSVFTVVTALEYALAKQQRPGPRLSVEYLNWAANQTGGDNQDGAFFSELWRGYAAYGICSEQDLPYQAAFEAGRGPDTNLIARAKAAGTAGLQLHWIKEWDVTTGLTEGHFVKIRQTLQQGWPVCGGMRWPIRQQWVAEVLQMCPPAEVRDGHSVLLVGYRDDPSQPGGGVFLFRNTSGPFRDAALPYAYARAYLNDAAWVGPAKIDKTAQSQ